MNGKILVAYATTHGSTQEIAESVAEALRERGLEVDVQQAGKVGSLEGYKAVVLGAPLYMFHLHGDARRFLTKFRKVLEAGMPAAIFAGGPFEKADEQEFADVRKQLDQDLAKYPWFKPKSIEVVGGKFDPTGLKFPWNLTPYLKGLPPSDKRDWDKIKGWAESLPQFFAAPDN